MYTIVFQSSKICYRYVCYAPDGDSLLDWLRSVATAYARQMTYLLVIDSDKHILLKYKRPAR